ncbi:hypothetical protein [Nocardia bhagyanarayanae]|uniref:Uncharacterized protein n=1 Tax=Nocardia bhagyanarayanae TaxID=1215925 RepID=A0A543F7I3_9NOCA|nr:hypothetical protein [Nocardia bhagyanarayanae]TQM29771.1 hypothetical protein FB390_1383 [Nocardia bhagyanarayanae]
MYFGFAVVAFVAGLAVSAPLGLGVGAVFFALAAVLVVVGVVRLRRTPLPTSPRHRTKGWGAAASAGGFTYFGDGGGSDGRSGGCGGGSSCSGGGGCGGGGGGGGCGGGG